MTFRLEREGVAPLELTPVNGFHVRNVDLGFPSPRTVIDDRPLANGTDDRTRFFGERVVTLDLLASGPRQVKVDQLSPFLVPDGRSFLYFDGPQPRRIRLRGRSRQAAFRLPNKQEIVVQWDAPDGVAETAFEVSRTVFASVGVSPGFTFDVTFDLAFPAASPSGRTNVPTSGNARCYPVAQLWGPCVFPRIDNLQDVNDEGVPKQLAFDVSLSAGQYLEVDFRERTVLLNGNPAQNRYSTLDFAVSEWWTLGPGTNFVKYFPDSFSGNARAEMLYRCTFL